MSAPTRDQMEFANAVRIFTLLALLGVGMIACEAQVDLRSIKRDVSAMRGHILAIQLDVDSMRDSLSDVRLRAMTIESHTDLTRRTLSRMESDR